MRHKAIQYFDPRHQEVLERPMIWADRLAIAFWLLTGGLGGIVYALWGDPGAFGFFEQIIGGLTFISWFSLRVLDWLFTGRIRYGT